MIPQRLLQGIYQLSSGWEKCYLVRTPEGNFLVDTPPAQEDIFSSISALGGARCLFITHRDTVGDAWLFRERLGLEVAIHRDDAESVTGCPVDRRLQDGDRLVPGTMVIHAPGHSPGCCALLLERDGGILFSGDVIITDEHGDLRLPLDGYSEDPRRARDAVSKLLRAPFRVLLPAHGAPILEGAQEHVRAFTTH